MIQTSDSAQQTSVDTKEKLLDAAEQLFTKKGLASTSLREITSRAGVNLAAVNYHFGSKEALIRAVFERRIGPANRRRLVLLDACEAAAGPSPPRVEDLIRAFVEPVLHIQGAGSDLRPLVGRMYVEPGENVQMVLRDQMREVARRFTEAFRRALPELPLPELLWRMHFSVGALLHTMAGHSHLQVLSGGLCDSSDVNGTIERLVRFLAAGLRAPVGERRES